MAAMRQRLSHANAAKLVPTTRECTVNPRAAA